MASEAVLRLGVDPRPAQKGMRDYKRALDEGASASQRLADTIEANAKRETGIYQRAAQERLQLERRLATQRSASAKVDAVAAAESFVKAQESYYQTNMARIRAAQARGLMSAKEASVAGQEAALAYNNAIVNVLDSPRYQGDRKAFTALAGSIKNIGESGKSAGVGMHRLNNSLVVLARRATGTHPVVGQLADVVGTFAIGTAKMVPILAGIAAIGGAWAVVTQDAREAKKQLEENLDVLRRIRRERDIEARGGETQIAVEAAQARARELADVLRSAQATGGLLLSGGGVSPTGPILEELRDLNRIIAAGLAEIEETEEESRERRLEDEQDFQRRMRELRGRVAMMAEIEPRTLSDWEARTGIRPPDARTPLQYGQSGLYDPGLVRGTVTRSEEGRNEFQKWVGETAKHLKPLARGAEDSADALDNFSEGLLSQIDTGNFMASLGASLASAGFSFAMENGMVPALQTALLGTGYVSALEANTDALRDMSDVLLAQAFGELPDKIQDLQRFQDLNAQAQFQAREELLRRRFAATDADPEEQFRALQELLMQSVGGGFAPVIATLNTDNIDEFLTQVLDSIQAGTFDPELLGSLTADQFLDLLAELETLADSTGDVAEEMDKLLKSITALNSPQGLNLALLGYNAGLGELPLPPDPRDTGGGRRGDPGDGGGRDTGGGSRGGDDEEQRRRSTTTHVTINVNGSRDPSVVAEEVVRRFEREAARGGPTTFTTLREVRR